MNTLYIEYKKNHTNYMLKRSRLVLVHIHAAKELFSLFSLLVIGIGVYQALFLKKLQCNNSKEYIYIYAHTHTHTHTHTHKYM